MADQIQLKINGKSIHYPIIIGENISENFQNHLARYFSGEQIAIVTTDLIYSIYQDFIHNTFESDKNCLIIVQDGEKAKSDSVLQNIYSELLKHKFERNSLIIAFGGGVIGDLAGFASATYLRGIHLVQFPTTLLAQVDSSIGGKVGINPEQGKNLIGAFKHPLFVFSDIALLKTLPKDELLCGLGEVVKYGLIKNPGLFNFLENNMDDILDYDSDALKFIVSESTKIKANIVQQDEKESGLRMILNFGHTFGHALEADFGYKDLKHGQAILLGMKCAVYYAGQSGKLNKSVADRINQLLKKIPIEYDKNGVNPKTLYERMQFDKKVKNSNIRLVLIKDIGSFYFEENSDESLIKESFSILRD